MNTTPAPATPPHPRIRPATRDDVPEILELIHELAVYEKEPDAVKASVGSLTETLVGSEVHAWCHVAEAPEGSGRRIDGIALWFLTFSTWEGRHGIHLEDLYVRPEARGQGLGLALMRTLATLATERGYRRLEWVCLEWNAPSIEFYRSLGAVTMDEWLTFRLDGEALAKLGS